MKKIDAHEKSLKALLSGKYTIHYYQREYRWGRKQIEELLDDLTEEFREYYEPEHELTEVDRYGHYYLGTIVLSDPTDEDAQKDNAIIDGQQRLTSLTLLLIYLNNLQQAHESRTAVDTLIFSEHLGVRSFNIHVEERTACLEALYRGEAFDPAGEHESVQTMYARYQDIEELFPDDLKGEVLPFFLNWLILNVDLVEIKAKTEQDANKIFVTMNDRGLSLTPAEMLKGYLLSRIVKNETRNRANAVWKEEMALLNQLGPDEDAAFLKNWLRAQYAETIRQTKKGAQPEDYDLIGTTFHKWLRQNTRSIGLERSRDYEAFVLQRLPKYSRIYRTLKDASDTVREGLEAVYYNASRNFTLQYQVALAAIAPDDSPEVVRRKLAVVALFLDQYVTIRAFNFKSVAYSTIKNAMFSLTKKIRRLPLPDLATTLQNELKEMEHTLDGIDSFYLNQFSKRYMLHILARMTHYLETESGRTVRFEDYVRSDIRNPYDIEHIWANRYERHADHFDSEDLFARTRNSFGALLMLPRDVNRSLQDKPYASKQSTYAAQNLLAASLSPRTYEHNPQWLRLLEREGLPLKPVEPPFSSKDIQERQQAYKAICARIWNPDHLAEAAA